MKKRRRLLPAAVTLCVDQIGVHHLHGPIPDAVHPLYPQHLILRLELFSDTLTNRHLFYQLKEHSLCLLSIIKVKISYHIIYFLFIMERWNERSNQHDKMSIMVKSFSY